MKLTPHRGRRKPAAAPGGVRGSSRRTPPAQRWRHYAVLALFLIVFVGLAARAAFLTVTDEREFLRGQGEARAVREVEIPVHRGMIFDRNGEPLAVSAPMRYVWLDPELAQLESADLVRLAGALGLGHEVLERRIAAGGRRFAYLARRISPETAERVAALDIDGVRIGRSSHRFYPAGETSAHVVGRTDIDDVGQEGIELALDGVLTGAPGAKRVLRDRTGRAVRNLAYLRAPERGEDVHLSLDLRLQFLAYRELKATVQYHGASAGSLVMLDAADGRVLALANQPSFNPNDWESRSTAGVRNRAVTDLYEPGSTVKPLAVLAALESGLYTPETEVDTAPGYMNIGGKVVEDPLNRGVVTVAWILAKSSQVGIAKMALAMPEQAVFDVLQRAGLGDYTGCRLPGEAIGHMSTADLDKPIGRAALAYGYGLTVSPLQLARAYLTLASGGIKRDVSVLRDSDSVAGERVFEADAVADVAAMMRGVLETGGTAPKAKPAGYSAAGKTGTVRKVVAGGYDDRAHVAYFAGFAPAEHPRIVMVVVVDQPRRGLIGGGDVAAPVFGHVAARALRILGVAPSAEQSSAIAA